MLRNLLFPLLVVADVVDDDVVVIMVDISGIASSLPFPSPWDVLLVDNNEAGEEAVGDEAAE